MKYEQPTQLDPEQWRPVDAQLAEIISWEDAERHIAYIAERRHGDSALFKVSARDSEGQERTWRRCQLYQNNDDGSYAFERLGVNNRRELVWIGAAAAGAIIVGGITAKGFQALQRRHTNQAD